MGFDESGREGRGSDGKKESKSAGVSESLCDGNASHSSAVHDTALLCTKCNVVSKPPISFLIHFLLPFPFLFFSIILMSLLNDSLF